jgi:hypothetical protein
MRGRLHAPPGRARDKADCTAHVLDGEAGGGGDDALAVPTDGVSLSALREFVAAHAGCTLPPAAEEVRAWEVQPHDGGGHCDAPPPAPLLFEALTTAQVVARVVKPATAATGGSYAELLRARATLRRDADAAGKEAEGEPDVAPATWFVSHAWQYNFSEFVHTVLRRFHGGGTQRVYVWLGASPCPGRKSLERAPRRVRRPSEPRARARAQTCLW